MLRAISGDIAGSRYEWHNIKSKVFDLLTHHCRPTDDSAMALAVANALLDCNGQWKSLAKAVVQSMQELSQDNYGTPGDLRWHAQTFLDERQLSILNAFEAKYGTFFKKFVTDTGRGSPIPVPTVTTGRGPRRRRR